MSRFIQFIFLLLTRLRNLNSFSGFNPGCFPNNTLRIICFKLLCNLGQFVMDSNQHQNNNLFSLSPFKLTNYFTPHNRIRTCDLILRLCHCLRLYARKTGDRGEIRTHGPLSRPTVFKTVALNHSATLPFYLAVSEGLEPTTIRLTGERSTIELTNHIWQV